VARAHQHRRRPDQVCLGPKVTSAASRSKPRRRTIVWSPSSCTTVPLNPMKAPVSTWTRSPSRQLVIEPSIA
jgi:hypothetical protein